MSPQSRRPIRVVLKSSSSSASSGTASVLTAGKEQPKSAIRHSPRKRPASEPEIDLDLESDGLSISSAVPSTANDASESPTSDADDFDFGLDLSGQEEETQSPKKLTARQKAMLAPGPESEPDSVSRPDHDQFTPISGKKRRHLTEEELAVEAEKARRRKHQRDQKLEESKKATIERLLQKQSARSKKTQKTIKDIEERRESDSQPDATVDPQVPTGRALEDTCLKWLSSRDGNSLLVPDELASSVFEACAAAPPEPTRCSRKGCSKPKRYSLAAVPNKPICSIECYRKMFK